MKTNKYIFIILLLVLGITSCSDDDGYSLGKYWRDIVTVNDKNEGEVHDFTLDNGSKLSVVATSTNYKPKYKRAIVNYTILGDIENSGKDITDYYIKLNRVYDVLTKDVIYIAPDDKQKQDSIGYDPVKIYSIWEGGDYLNIYYGVNVGGAATHYINLVSAGPIGENNSNSNVVQLEFRHNKNNDPENYGAKNYVSFDLQPFKKADSGTVTFEISVKEFGSDEPQKYTVEYKYSGTASKQDNQSPDIEIPSDKISD